MSATSSHNGCIVLAHQIKETKSGSFNFSITLTKWALLHFAPYLLAIRRKKCEEECKKNCTNRRATTRLFCNARKLFLQAWCASLYLLIRVLRTYSTSKNDHKWLPLLTCFPTLLPWHTIYLKQAAPLHVYFQ